MSLEIINQMTSAREPEWVLLSVSASEETCSDDISKYLWEAEVTSLLPQGCHPNGNEL